MSDQRWQFWIDVGGTFTDCIGRRPDGALVRHKLLSAEDAPLVAIRELLGLDADEPIPPCSVRLGTTRGTNALLTRRGARTAFVTTKGFGDCLEIGYQSRPKIFALDITKPPPLASVVVEVDERVAADGSVLRAPDFDRVSDDLARLRDSGIESLAICFLHADLYPDHEQHAAEIARDLGFAEVSVSHEVAPLPRLVARGDTTVVDAYLNPVLRSYVERLLRALPGSSLRLLTSSGGLVAAEAFRGKDSILSGPAGGAVAFARVARACGFARAIGLDMGGTSTDVSRFDGRHDMEYETTKAGVRIVAPMFSIETVAAGGGSICRFDGVKLVVGPESAGADPGPACYGRGGPLAVTDLNLFLGRIGTDALPFTLDLDAVQRRLTELATEVATAMGRSYSYADLALSLLDIANANMAAAIRTVTVARGADARRYPLVAFGGAAPQHACAIAAALNIDTIIVHPDASILSALGAGLARITRHRERGIDLPLSSDTYVRLDDQFRLLEAEAVDELLGEGVARQRIAITRLLDVRYAGTDWPITIEQQPRYDWKQAFQYAHNALFGYVRADKPLRATAVRIEAAAEPDWSLPDSRGMWHSAPQPATHRVINFRGLSRDTPVFARSNLRPGDRLIGPAVVEEPHSTLVVDDGWEGEMYSQGEIVLRRKRGAAVKQSIDVSAKADPAQLEILNNQLVAIAEQMGHTLRRTAVSVNIKERLDYSCAIFTADGRLVASAPHVPVHLGAMGESVRCILADNPDMEPGDVFVTNDPYRGGSHLPDVTIVRPVHDDEGRLLFFTAARGHHAEIGGKSPGSMPPDAANLGEEGVVIRNFLMVHHGETREDELRQLLTAEPYPTRAVEDNLADIRAQIAATHLGAGHLAVLIDEYSWPVVAAYMQHIQAAAATKCRQALATCVPEGRRSFADTIETVDGVSVPICVAVERRLAETANRDPSSGGKVQIPCADKRALAPIATFDFTGTGPVLASNLNANRGIVTAALIYCLRLLIDEDIPLNDGVLDPVDLILPECFLNPKAAADARRSPPVAGGNVETSQRIVDVILGAMGVAAASQGTMNNLLVGDERFGYYETICGGSGATSQADGADAVQVHMTNTRITDPEILERRYPLRLWEFSIRRGSGGKGKHRGGDGVVREFEFLGPLTVAILSSRRGPHPPYGLAGGEPGALGRNLLTAADGTRRELPGICTLGVQPGDRLRIETPGGGGWGRSD